MLRRLGLILRGRRRGRQARRAALVSHDAAKGIGRSVAQGWRRALRRGSMGRLARDMRGGERHSAVLQFQTQGANFTFVSTTTTDGCQCERGNCRGVLW